MCLQANRELQNVAAVKYSKYDGGCKCYQPVSAEEATKMHLNCVVPPARLRVRLQKLAALLRCLPCASHNLATLLTQTRSLLRKPPQVTEDALYKYCE